ncbi:MAG: polyprenyl synthetase family protein, partial [Bdellovibrionaceae bacterium]|nr:polyprenyl synthetase family protein [Pseudobdellovibrionaceae bacterium]
MPQASWPEGLGRIAAAVDEQILKWWHGRSVSALSQEMEDSILYSSASGGKRFRPVLALLSCEALNVPSDLGMPWAVAVEFIHTYSLIHDDLPAMDND